MEEYKCMVNTKNTNRIKKYKHPKCLKKINPGKDFFGLSE